MAKTALITGASQGLGACMAKTLAADGFNIAINCLGERERENGGNQVAEACRTLGVEAECFLCDVSDFTACEAMAARHMGMEVCGISCITNMAAGVSNAKLNHAEVQETADRVAKDFEKLVTDVIAAI